MIEFQLEIVTPIRELDQGQVSYVRCSGLDGSFGVMANHREGIIALTVFEIKFKQFSQFKGIGGGLRVEMRLLLIITYY